MSDSHSYYSFSKKTTTILLIVMAIAYVLLFVTAPKPHQLDVSTLVPGNLPLQLWGGPMGGDGMEHSPLWVQLFLKSLFAWALLGLFFMPKYVDARWASGGILFAIFSTFFIIPPLPIVSLGGMYAVLHFILWTPGLYLLLKNRRILKERSLFAIWSCVMAGIISFSYIFDVRDTLVYVPFVWNLHTGG